MMDPKEVLEFWFGRDPQKLTKQYLWFKQDSKKITQIKERFSDILTRAEKNELDSWCSESKSTLALIIILNQFTRCIHWGQREMFSNEPKALKLATDLIKDTASFNQLTCIEKYFVYVVLLNVEELEIAKQGLNGIEVLQNECLPEQKDQFSKLFKISLNTYMTLLDFGRFPQRNVILERLPTLNEIAFLKKQPIYKRSFIQPEIRKARKQPKKNKVEATESKKVAQRILFLHGFRQNSNKIKKRLGNLLSALKLECNTHVTFLNGTLPYQERASQEVNEALKNPIESQRVWYNPSSDFIVYHGIDEAYAHILTHIKSSPAYDGIIGFSQGGVMASLIARRNPELFNYFILISSYKPRCLQYAQLFTPEEPLKSPSLHIYGKTDTMVLPERSRDLARCFEASETLQHNFGHFAPNEWPLEGICQFVSEQAGNIRPPVFDKKDGLEANILKFNISMVRFKFEDLNLDDLFEATHLIKSDEFKSFFIQKNVSVFDSNVIEDKVLVAYVLMNIAASDDEAAQNLVGCLWLRIYNQHKEQFLTESILDKCFVAGSHWKELVGLCDLAYQNKLTDLYEMIIEMLADQILSDLILYDRLRDKHIVQELTSIHKNEHTCQRKAKRRLNELSDLALYLPRIKNAIDRRSRIGREIACQLNNYKVADLEKIDNLKIESYNKYRKVVSLLSKHSNRLEAADNPRQYSFLARYDKAAMELLMKAPLSDSIVNPVPEPVDIASRDQMQPLYDWLKARARIDDELDLRFLKGVVTRDGRLDLCKQVIGPMGIEPLLEAMANSRQVDRVLLGNNIIGDDGGKVIADFIKSGKSTIKIWYIAGNKFTSTGIKPIAEALENDTFVTGLWLKRNPLKMPGMIPISNLLTHNKSLQVLDLLNCGLLDEGVCVLFKDLHLNTTLKHIYLSANGITPVGLTAIRDYFNRCKSQLESLFLGCNRVGDEGAAIVADIIRADSMLSRLNLASCRIGAAGMKSLSVALIEKDTLRTLDLGYMRSTMDMGELGNYIEDEGAEYLGKFVKKSKRLASLNISHNHISEIGMQMLMCAIRENRSLVELEYVQYGVSLDSVNASELKKSLERNQKLFLEDNSQEELDDVKIPEHVREIYSVYRTH